MYHVGLGVETRALVSSGGWGSEARLQVGSNLLPNGKQNAGFSPRNAKCAVSLSDVPLKDRPRAP